ncbi:DMT family transporter [Brevundimonas sp. NIBR11]|uniref:EamA family transporter n=1 Tax=Brevundimonas sp. NIBR11 TaxID=3015999 RepID=UPI0022F03D6C|nr:DMT family transporter [Brevundimonas sp. NIBR11]WGM30236.1 Threonine/homoserine exporter RhtA [Brevundimonas sp. NIBR11]
MSMIALRQTLNSPRLASAAPYAALLGAMLSLAFGTSFAKQMFPMVGAEGTAALRVGLAALMLLAVFRPWRLRLGREDIKRVLAFGLVLGLMNLSFYMSLRTVPLGLALAIEFTGPLTLALIHARRLIHFVWIGCAAVGLLLLLPLSGGAGSLDPVGVGFALVAAVCWALYIVFGKRLSHIPSGPSVAMGMSVAALVILPFGVGAAGAGLFAPSVLILAVVVAICSSALPYSLDMVAMRGMPKRTFGVLLSGEPAIGAVAGMLFLHELLTGQQWLAIGCIVAASVGAILTTGKEEAAPVPTAN